VTEEEARNIEISNGFEEIFDKISESEEKFNNSLNIPIHI